MPIAELPHAAQISGRLDPHSRGALHQRLDDHRGDLLGMEVEHALELLRVAGPDPMPAEEERRVGGVEAVDPAHRHGAERVAVVAVRERDERGPPCVLSPSLAPVLERHLQRHLGGRRPGVGEEDPAQARRGELDQARRERGGAAMGQPEHRRMGDPLELVADRAVDQRMAVPVDVAPKRRDSVDVPLSLRVDQVGAVGALDHQRRLPAPFTLLGEGMPEVAMVEVTDGLGKRVR